MLCIVQRTTLCIVLFSTFSSVVQYLQFISSVVQYLQFNISVLVVQYIVYTLFDVLQYLVYKLYNIVQYLVYSCLPGFCFVFFILWVLYFLLSLQNTTVFALIEIQQFELLLYLYLKFQLSWGLCCILDYQIKQNFIPTILDVGLVFCFVFAFIGVVIFYIVYNPTILAFVLGIF